jgi:hypothetical protein
VGDACERKDVSGLVYLPSILEHEYSMSVFVDHLRSSLGQPLVSSELPYHC